MAQQTINVGAAPNDGTGTPLRTAFQYTNSNFSELYTAVGPSGNNIVVPGNATITGDLTVDTNVLKVDTTLNRVGIGTATPVSSLQVLDGDITVTTGGSFSGFNGTRQTVPSSVGTQLSRLHFSAYSTGTTYVQGASIQSYSDAAWSASSAPAYLAFYTTPSASVTLSERYRIASDGVATWSNVGGVAGTAMTLNSTGLGVGVTPSAWNTAYKAIELGSNVGSFSATTGIFDSALNAFFNTSSQWIYKTTAAATIYRQQAGEHRWFNAASGTAGTAVTFTQAMTLDASGRLLVGGTTGFSIPNGAGTAFTPSVQSITTSGSSAVCAVVSDGTNNRRIGLFVDNDNGINGISANKTTTSVPFVYRDSGNERLRIDTSGNLISTVPATPPTLAANSQMVFNLTSDTNLRISVRGTDGTTRTANITLA
jgi:hypothetical protein